MSQPTTNITTDSRFLSFSLGKEEYAIELLSVREVTAIPEITPVPFTPSYFLGFMNLRGQVISIIDLRQKFNIKSQNNPKTAVIICDLKPIVLGIVVDSINSVIAPTPEEIAPKPHIESNQNTEYITGVYQKDKRLVLFLNINKTLNVEDRSAIAKASSGQKAA